MLIDLIVVIVLVGVVLYFINRFVPMESTVKQFLNVVVIIILAFYVLRALGLLDALNIPLR